METLIIATTLTIGITSLLAFARSMPVVEEDYTSPVTATSSRFVGSTTAGSVSLL